MIDLGSVVDNAYSYGKTGIATLVRQIFFNKLNQLKDSTLRQVMNSINEKDPVRAAQIEKIISEALDRVQRAWLTQGESTPITKLSSASIDNNFHSSIL